jgi:aerobic carbon-monoxide dehydrogenase medium subunit
MIPVQFGYETPSSLEEAIHLLNANNGATILAGGLGLIGAMNARRTAPALLIDLRKIDGLAGARVTDDGSLVIGAMTSCASILADPAIGERWPAIADALQLLGDPQVRNRATVGGSLAEANPTSDLLAVALALGASVRIAGTAGSRTLPIDELIAEPYRTSLERGEVITTVVFPASGPNRGSAYEKFKNPASGRAICGVSAFVERTGNVVGRCAVALCGATRHVTRLPEVEAAIQGHEPTIAAVESAAAAVQHEGLEFVSDLAASGEYRAHLVEVLVARALTRAIRRSGLQ